ncbi:hypothetical protein Desaci_2013 [Desulfosporosinus acidiphilus SJ4]|uniref:Uncharacterized protein n=1 Tax=Desulfosporosinus acidiphilus (strain DSM 22704 / JCM 16185 / SJ4) TaxID=646529 RepID=I4D5B4_DESAJ|nr:hypothetical protein [Desulfosporosinus acidiphilus]AFM40988.1 hypothetical protein Desaci_2013 [Desulfosporosinus acidiphilus SJ4]
MTSKIVRFITINFSLNPKYYIVKYGLEDIAKTIEDFRNDLNKRR